MYKCNFFFHPQIQDLLQAMNLSQYKERFSQEEVSGQELSTLDEEALENRLGIKQRLHRKRLMMIINGTKPIQEQTNDENYVNLRKAKQSM